MTAESFERTIVVGLDNTPAARAALRWAVRRASRLKAAVRAVHVLELPGSAGPLEHDPAGERATVQGRAQDWVAGALTGLAVEAPVTIDVRDGDPAEVLSRAARHAEILVLGKNPDSATTPITDWAVPLGCELVVIDESGQLAAHRAAVGTNR